MEMAVRSIEMAEMEMETDGNGSGALPCPGRVPEQILLSPKIRRRRRRSCGTLSGNLLIVLGFFVGRLLIGEGVSSEVDQGGLTMGGRGQGIGRAPLSCGQPLAPLRLPFGPRHSSGKNRSFQTYFVQFREYFLCSFSETQKLQKMRNWHCGILSIG
jgi:hypothetical protein